MDLQLGFGSKKRGLGKREEKQLSLFDQSNELVLDVGWGMFLECLKNKALEYGKTLYEVSSLLGSTRLCSKCGRRQKMDLGQREYICACGQRIDRDLNAAINIKNWAVGASV